MANTLAVTIDRGLVLTPEDIAIQDDAKVPLSITFEDTLLDAFNPEATFRLDWQLPDGTKLYMGSYPIAASTDDDIPATIFVQAGLLFVQVVVEDGDIVWHSQAIGTRLQKAISAADSASTDPTLVTGDYDIAVGDGTLTFHFINGRLASVEQVVEG